MLHSVRRSPSSTHFSCAPVLKANVTFLMACAEWSAFHSAGPDRPAASTRGSSSGSRLGVVPDFLLGEVHQACEHDQEDHHLQPDALALHEVRLGCPHQECRYVLRVLIERLRSTVIISYLAVLQRLRHRDIVAREIFVVVAILRQLETLRWL